MSNPQAELTEFARAHFICDATGQHIGAIWLLAADRYAAWSRQRKLGEFAGVVEAETAVRTDELEQRQQKRKSRGKKRVRV